MAMVAEGAAVALGARRKDRLDELAERIEADGGTAVAIEADIADEDAGQARFVETAHAELGGLDILVNNAGVMLLGPLQGADPSEWRTMIEVNCLGLLYCTHAALPLMRDGGGGDIVNVSSVAGRRRRARHRRLQHDQVGGGRVLGGAAPGGRSTSASASPASSRASSRPSFRATTRTRWWSSRSRRCARRSARCSRPRTSPTRSSTPSRQPEHVSINEILVRPSGQTR